MINSIRKICSVLIVCVLISSIIGVLTTILGNKDSENYLRAFLDEQQEIDVFFLGTSHVRDGVFPMDLWDEYGIASYNLAGYGDTIPVCYWKLEMALNEKNQMLLLWMFLRCFLEPK